MYLSFFQIRIFLIEPFEIRKKYNLKLGDSIIAATASVHGLEIYTRNLSDFERVKRLKCVNPIR